MPETAKILVDKVRELQRKLWVCAQQSKTRRFHALYDRIYRSDVLWRAWMRVRSNGGAAGVDQATLRSIEERGVTQFLEGIQADLKAGRYRPSPVMRRWIPKADGKQRRAGSSPNLRKPHAPTAESTRILSHRIRRCWKRKSGNRSSPGRRS